MLLWTECVCDFCSTTTCGQYADWGKRSAKEVKSELKKEGWVVIGDKVYCKQCFAKYG